ncbi:RNA methyltransferase [Synechococcus sp. FGCU-3]|nr:RNA methyltransferase [Synechococcus sp. FGCU3]
MSDLPRVAVVLVEPAGARNVGGVARAVANFRGEPLELELRLVAPRCAHLGEDARHMAVHAAPLLEQARVFASLPEALADCSRVVATSGRGEGEPMPPLDPDAALGWLLGAPAEASTAVVFGREDRGLSRDELLMAGQLLTIETGPGYGSLNLAQAAAVVLQRLRVRATAPPGALGESATTAAPLQSVPRREPQGEPAQRRHLEDLLADAEELLLEVGFLHPHTAHARMAKVRGLLQRGLIDDGEVALLRGMVRQLRWASRRLPPHGQTP